MTVGRCGRPAADIVNQVAAVPDCNAYAVETWFRSEILDSLHWGYLIPVGIALVLGTLLAHDVGGREAENSSTAKLRLMVLIFGLAFLYLAFLAWRFDLSLSRFGRGDGTLGGIVFFVTGVILVSMAAFRSRAGLVRDSDYFTKSPSEIDLDGRPDITPADRVDKHWDTADPKTGSDT